MYPEGSCLDIFDVDNYVKQIMLQLHSLVQRRSRETRSPEPEISRKLDSTDSR